MDANTLCKNSFIWDDHAGFEMLPDSPIKQLMQPWRDANINYISINVYYDPQPYTEAMENIMQLRERLPVEAPYCQVVSTLDDVDQAHAAGKLAVTFDIEGMNALDGRVEMVQQYYDVGIRHMLLAYNRNNKAASGCHDEDIGLTSFGSEVIDEMNRVGMVVDCSHAGFRASMAAIERSRDPVVFSHSNAKALVDHGRNITDEQIRACAATGGVIGINGAGLFLGEDNPMPSTIAKHVAYMAEMVGAAHVGLSMDYDPTFEIPDAEIVGLDEDPYYWPEGNGYEKNFNCLDVRRLPEVVQELLDIGFNKEDLTGILGGNFKRVAREVWK